jgi:hypothetical protein
MKRAQVFVFFLFFGLLAVGIAKPATATPATSFSQQNGDWYDNWNIDRNYPGYNGELPGYLPNLASESLGENRELAYSIGQQFQQQYSDVTACAAAILKYVQTWTYYAYDSDTFVRDGVAQDEWAQNADEFAHAFNQTTGAIAPGDCEDMAFLCATLYAGAGFDAAVVDAPEHAACLIWLPQFSDASDYWDLNDGKGAGWIWVEATGSSNPLGWTPSDYEDGQWTAYQINSTPYVMLSPSSSQPGLGSSGNTDTLGIIVFVILGIVVGAIRLSRRSYV